MNVTPLSHFPDNENLEFRHFEASRYPDFVRNALTYSFKPLIISEVLKEYPMVWWNDAHFSMVEPTVVETVLNEVGSGKVPSSVVPVVGTDHSNFAVLHPGYLLVVLYFEIQNNSEF